MTTRTTFSHLAGRALLAVGATSALWASTAAAAPKATWHAPATVALHGRISVSANGLAPAKYGLYIGFVLSHPKGGQAIVCSGPIGSARKVSGRVTFVGRLPKFLGCRTAAGPLLTTVSTKPRPFYTLILGVQLGHGTYSGDAAFFERNLQVTP